MTKYQHGPISQFLGLVKVSLREWIRPAYKKNADTVALQIVGLSVMIFFIGATAFLSHGTLELMHRIPFPIRVAILLILGVPFTKYFLDGWRPEVSAEEAKKRWPRLANHARAVSILFCSTCFVPAVVYLILNP